MDFSEIELEGIRLFHENVDDEKKLTVFLNGYLDSANSPKASGFLNAIPENINGIKKIVLDLNGLTYASSTGIGSFTALLIVCKKKSVELELINISKKILDVFSLLGFTAFFTVKEKM